MVDLGAWVEKNIANSILKEPRKNITCKPHYYALQRIGYFGNIPKTWGNYEEFSKSNYKGRVSIRSKKGIDRDNVRYNIPSENVLRNIKEMELDPREVSINESMPNNLLTIQGEIIQLDGRTGHCGLELRYSDLKEVMNKALKEKEMYLRGLNALLKIKSVMDPPSYENLNRLFEEFPEHAIEFSSYEIVVGNLGHNTIFWEARNY